MPPLAISHLFVPGSRPDRFLKAITSGADRTILDLEDAVTDDEKDAAFEHVVAALGEVEARVMVRVNSPESVWFERDIAGLRAADPTAKSLAGIVIPKAEDPEVIARVVDAFEGREVIPLIESALGVHRCEQIAAVPGICRLAFGAVDFSVDVGVGIDSALIDSVYARLVIASRVTGVAAPIAPPPLVLRDPVGIETAARRLRSMGMGGQLCVHPDQVQPIHTGFAPTAEQTAWAESVLASVGTVQVNGQMVDRPVRDRAVAIIAQRREAK